MQATNEQLAREAASEIAVPMDKDHEKFAYSIILAAIEKAYEEGYSNGWKDCDREASISAAQPQHIVIRRNPTRDPYMCEKCGASLGWCEPFICDKCEAAQPQHSDTDEAYNERARLTPREARSPFSAATSEPVPPSDQVPLTIPGPHKTVADAMNQEWTPERIESYFGWKDAPSRILSERLANDINAALAAERSEREFFERSRDAWKAQVAHLTEALAAEREKVKPLVDLLREAHKRLGDTAFPSLSARIAAALAKVTLK